LKGGARWSEVRLAYHKLILRRIAEIVATRCQIVRLKCTKFDFSWGSAQTLLGELASLPRPSS